jgi:putative acetyltransferase
MELHIRSVQNTDNIILAQIIRAAFDQHNAPKQGTVYSDPTTDDLTTLFTSPNSVLWVGEVDGQVIGCCGIYPTPNLPEGYVELVKFYVNVNFRGQKLALQLFEKSMASAKEMGYTHIYIESLPHYSKAVKMYEQFGFTTLPQPLGQSGHTSCTVWMVKEI